MTHVDDLDHLADRLRDSEAIWQQDVCQQVRDLVPASDPEVVETIKRTRLPYFTVGGDVCALLATKDHVNIFIYDPIALGPEGVINQGHAIHRRERFKFGPATRLTSARS